MSYVHKSATKHDIEVFFGALRVIFFIILPSITRTPNNLNNFFLISLEGSIY